MEPIEALTAHDKELFENYITYFSGSKNAPSTSIDNLLRFWNTNKTSLFAAFGNKLILERRIEIQKTFNDLRKDCEDAIMDEIEVSNDFFYLLNKISEIGKKIFPAITDYRYPTEYILLDNFLTIDNLLRNSYDGRTFEIPIPDSSKTIKVQKGCRIMPTLHKIVTTFGLDEEKFERLRLFQSRILQNANTYGTLCLSIAPIDFISMSDNDSGWDSCMCWADHYGEYRQGTVEMMNSPCVLVAYLKAEKDYAPFEHVCYDKEISNWTISNKKWRQLVIANEDVILGNRQYPYENSDIEKQVLSWVRSLLGGDDCFSTQLTPIYNHGNAEDNPGGRSYRFNFDTNVMYNDVYDYRNAYLSTYFFEKYPTSFYLNFSGESECMECGELMDANDDSSWVICGKCNNVKICSCCESYIYDGDDYYTNDFGETFCSECVENGEVSWCDCCGQPFYDTDMVEIEFKSENSRFSTYARACRNCFPPLGEFGPRDEDDYFFYEENFSETAKDFINNLGL